MERTFGQKLKHAWNAFTGQDRKQVSYTHAGVGRTLRPDRPQISLGNEKSIIAAVYTRLGIDVASVDLRHVRVNQNGTYEEDIQSGINYCLQTEANIDQTGRALVQDIAMTLFDEGTAAVVPVETSVNPTKTQAYDIHSLRVGKVLEWYPQDVKVSLYDERVGRREEIIVPKKMAAIIENPLYAVMNEPNSTLKRLVRKLNLLDAADEKANSGKLDIIIQLPYTIKSDARQAQADKRKKNIEEQLTDSPYGIAYVDATEKITQLNRPAENNLAAQIETLTSMLYSQLGLTVNVFNGTADEREMLNYHNRTIEPILSAITDEMSRKFLSKTARTQGQRITFYRDPFRLVPVDGLADIADKFTRNEILTSNEVRAIVGFRPSEDPKADELRNKNLNQKGEEIPAPEPESEQE